MEYEWDSKKAISNLKKHGVDFADAIAVLEDERAITIPDDCPYEERLITIGMDFFWPHSRGCLCLAQNPDSYHICEESNNKRNKAI